MRVSTFSRSSIQILNKFMIEACMPDAEQVLGTSSDILDKYDVAQHVAVVVMARSLMSSCLTLRKASSNKAN